MGLLTDLGLILTGERERNVFYHVFFPREGCFLSLDGKKICNQAGKSGEKSALKKSFGIISAV